MTVNIHGKEYKTVAERVGEFRKEHPDYAIITEVLNASDLVQVVAKITDKEGCLISTGHAEEVRGSTNINKTSALENCETSAIGRALAFFKYAGTEIASSNEVMDAIVKQTELEMNKGFTEHMQAVLDNLESVLVIREYISREELSVAREAWQELSEEIQMKLWRASTKGGCFSTREREIMKSTEWRES